MKVLFISFLLIFTLGQSEFIVKKNQNLKYLGNSKKIIDWTNGFFSGLRISKSMPIFDKCIINADGIILKIDEIIELTKDIKDISSFLKQEFYKVLEIFTFLNEIQKNCSGEIVIEFEDYICELSKYFKDENYLKKLGTNILKNAQGLFEHIIRSKVYFELDLSYKMGNVLGKFIYDLVLFDFQGKC
jgi:hypothetical protein